jgi:pyoverdine/dityrosine biosynthesis protein Dit1/AcrR family transcriptional regulator
MLNRTKPYQICQSAIHLFNALGFEEVSMIDIANKASISEAELYSYYGSKNDIMLFLFQSINADWQAQVDALPSEKISVRFEQCLRLKIKLIEPYVGFLNQVIGLLIQNAKIGVTAPRTSHIREMGIQTMKKIIDESTNGEKLMKSNPKLPSIMYFMHWAVLFTRLQTNEKEKINELINILAKSLKQLNNSKIIKSFFPLLGELSKFTESLTDKSSEAVTHVDKEILKVIFNHRKTIGNENNCVEKPCQDCFDLHNYSVSFFTRQKKPIHFILPAFPAKSPNREKTLGKMPDLGEEIALKSLETMCKEIENVYSPGAHITICSDGRIFSELVGVSDEDISEYVAGIASMIDAHQISNISIINLEDLTEGSSFEEMRSHMISSYGEDLDSLKSNIKNKADMTSLFNGIHRFITEDQLAREKDKSKTQVKKESKLVAMKVIQHSNAWTRFLATVYPDAIRLSIHPYPAHNAKIGIQLTKTEDNWLTPWHGVITIQEDGYLLMKRSKAEELGAKLIKKKNQASHYSLVNKE